MNGETIRSTWPCPFNGQDVLISFIYGNSLCFPLIDRCCKILSKLGCQIPPFVCIRQCYKISWLIVTIKGCNFVHNNIIKDHLIGFSPWTHQRLGGLHHIIHVLSKVLNIKEPCHGLGLYLIDCNQSSVEVKLMSSNPSMYVYTRYFIVKCLYFIGGNLFLLTPKTFTL